MKLVFSSPPYPGQRGNKQTVEEWLEWLGYVVDELRPLLVENGVVVLNVMFRRREGGWFDSRVFTEVPRVFEARGLNCLDGYIWNKTNGPMNGPLLYCDAPGYEMLYVYSNAVDPMQVTFNGQYKAYAGKSIASNGEMRIGYGRTKAANSKGARQTNVISLPTSASDGKRPRAKGVSFPLALAERFILQYTRPGDMVLDFCAGVGTTCVVAQEIGRGYIGIEMDAAEAEKARKWLE